MADSCVETVQVKKEEPINTHTHHHQDDELENTKVEMGEVREENERLRMKLVKIEKEYKSLQLRFFDILKQEPIGGKKSAIVSADQSHVIDEPDQLVSLCLGRSPRGPKIISDENSTKTDDHEDQLKANLTLGLGSELHLSTTELVPFNPTATATTTPENSIISEELIKEVEEGGVADHAGPNSMTTKSSNNKTMRNGEDEASDQQTQAKRARVSVRARCDAPTMNDGCQWRKYGQKISKGNPCPRAYYRCTVALGCPVRKQVQRCASDMSILITTYEGTHNHPLPISATAMASTTSAAASMLLSGSSTSQQGINSISTATINSIPRINNNGINFGIYDNLRGKHFHSTNSPSPFHPTITLDLTASPSSSASPFSHLSSNNYGSTSRLPSSNLSFSSPDHQYSSSPTVWGNRYLSYGSSVLSYDKNQIGSLNVGKQSQDYLYQCYMGKNNQNQAASTQDSLTETLTKAITSDPSFKSVMAAALSSVVGGS